MTSELRDELKAFERDLAAVIARFLRLYERMEKEVRPETRESVPQVALPRQPVAGYQ